jgi:pyruvate-formate lyase-activating enzyme
LFFLPDLVVQHSQFIQCLLALPGLLFRKLLKPLGLFFLNLCLDLVLFDVGLDSLRVSLNSVRPQCYQAYFQPQGYDYADVIKSIDIAIGRQKFVAINYLNMPGFTDTPQEMEALIAFIKQHRINMIQWRNLNFDPLRYINSMDAAAEHGQPVGMQTVLQRIRQIFPNVKHGYFNPPKERFNSI